MHLIARHFELLQLAGSASSCCISHAVSHDSHVLLFIAFEIAAILSLLHNEGNHGGQLWHLEMLQSDCLRLLSTVSFCWVCVKM